MSDKKEIFATVYDPNREEIPYLKFDLITLSKLSTDKSGNLSFNNKEITGGDHASSVAFNIDSNGELIISNTKIGTQTISNGNQNSK